MTWILLLTPSLTGSYISSSILYVCLGITLMEKSTGLNPVLADSSGQPFRYPRPLVARQL
jgi:hypothetical protein